MTALSRLRPGLTEALAPLGLVLDEAVLTPLGRRHVLTLVLDRDLPETETTTPVAPVSLDEITEATRAVDPVLQADPEFAERAYTLEVTSRGVSRPLTEPRHFRGNVGRLLTVAGETGRLTRVGTQDLDLDVAATKTVPAHRRTLTFAEASGAVVEVEFTKPAGSPADPTEPDPGEES